MRRDADAEAEAKGAMHRTEASLLRAGDVVRVRSRRWLVDRVDLPPRPGDETKLALSCLDDDAQGKSIEVLWEKEIDAVRPEPAAWGDLEKKDFDETRFFAAYLRALQWNCVTATDPKLFQAPLRAGIDPMAYQLEPLRKALLLPRVNLFIADDVGLGKTIEAGLIARELLLRQKVRRVVVACPASLIAQWQEEMESRFGLTFVEFDREFIAEKRRERGYAVNPWTTHSRFVISHARLRDEDYAAPLRDWLDQSDGGERPASLLILDEAHHAAPASASKYAVDSDFTRTIRDLAPRFEHRLFLSATPHNGYSNSFSALLEILDPQRFARGVPVDDKLRDEVLVRRLKSDLREIEPGFPERRIVAHEIDGLPVDAPELALSRLLDRYATALAARLAAEPVRRRQAALLVVRALQTRLLSSIEAFARTLAVHRRTLAKRAAAAAPESKAEEAPSPADSAPPIAPGLFDPPSADDDRAEQSDKALTDEHETRIAAATRRIGARSASNAEMASLLDEMEHIAARHRGRPDPRVDLLVAWIRENLCPTLSKRDALWNRRRVLIFTEWVDAKNWLEGQLTAALADSDRAEERLACLQGGPWKERRKAIQAAFNTDPDEHPLRILVATDAAREGLNLQNHCADVFHFDLPWNPSRIEQRNGRIDRKLQREPVVRCHHFVFVQRPEDRVLQALVRKTRVISEELGSLAPVLGARVEEILAAPISHEAAARKARAIDEAEVDAELRRTVSELEAVRLRKEELSEELSVLRKLLDKSAKHLRLTDAGLTAALSTSLELLSAPPLKLLPSDATTPNSPARFEFPRLDRHEGLGASWAGTLDALRRPQRENERLADWRRDAAPRAVTFRGQKFLDASTVQLHLEHRVVRRLLQRFLAQGFVYDDLARAVVGQTSDAIPRVILLARVSLYGSGAVRLHDEIMAVSAEWTDPATRKLPLQTSSLKDDAKALELLEAALGAPPGLEVSPLMRAKFRAAARRDVDELRPHFEQRALQVCEDAVKKLRERGAAEAKAMRAILEGQRRRVAKKLGEPQPWLAMKFGPEDQAIVHQHRSERGYWEKRMLEIPEELESEPARILAGYETRATRTEFVGLAYLWPVSG